MMETSGVFAGMLVIILIGIAVEYLIFAGIEKEPSKSGRPL